MNEQEQQETYDLAGALEAIRQRLLLVVGLGALGALVAGLAAAAPSTTYQATAELLVRSPDAKARILEGPSSVEAQPELSPEATLGLFEVDRVAELAARELPDTSREEVLDDVSLRHGDGPELVDVVATSDEPERAAELANAVAEAAIDFRRDLDRSQIARSIGSVEQALAELPADERNSPEAKAYQRQIRQLRSLELVQTGSTELAVSAEAPSEPEGSGVLRSAVIGGVAGVTIGLLAALVLERLRPRLRRRREFEAAYALPVLAELSGDGNGGGAGPGDPRGPDREELRALWAQLRVGGPVRSVVVASLCGGAGAAEVALGLARVAAGEGEATILAEGDLRHPCLAGALGLAPEPGLAEHLGHETERLDALLQEVPLSGPGGEGALLRVLPAGAPPPNPVGLLAGDAGTELVADLSARSELLVLDVPPLGEAADGLLLAPHADGLVLVDRPGLSDPSQVGRLLELLRGAEIRVLGLVLDLAPGGRPAE